MENHQQVAALHQTPRAGGSAHLILRDAVDAHGGDGCEHHADGEQAEELAGDGVARVLQRQPQALPDAPVADFLEVLHVSVTAAAAMSQSGRTQERRALLPTCSGPKSRPRTCRRCWRRSRRPSCGGVRSPACGHGNGNYSNCPGRTH